MKKISLLACVLAAGALALNADHHRGKPGKKGPGMMPGKMFEMIDTDKDGKISKQEWQTHHEQRFTELDADKDGFVTKDEMKAHHEMMREKRPGMCPDCDGPGKGKGKGMGKKRPKNDDEDDDK